MHAHAYFCWHNLSMHEIFLHLSIETWQSAQRLDSHEWPQNPLSTILKAEFLQASHREHHQNHPRSQARCKLCVHLGGGGFQLGLKTQTAQILMSSERQAGSSQRVTCKQGRFIMSKQKPTIWSHISWHFIMIQKIYPHSCLWQVCLFAPWKSYLNKTHRFLRPLCNPGPPRAGMALALCPTSMVTHFAMD